MDTVIPGPVGTWCHWCRKANHTDAQCYSTRPVDWRPKPDDAEPAPRSREVAQVLQGMQLTPKPVAWALLQKYIGH